MFSFYVNEMVVLKNSILIMSECYNKSRHILEFLWRNLIESNQN